MHFDIEHSPKLSHWTSIQLMDNLLVEERETLVVHEHYFDLTSDVERQWLLELRARERAQQKSLLKRSIPLMLTSNKTKGGYTRPKNRRLL